MAKNKNPNKFLRERREHQKNKGKQDALNELSPVGTEIAYIEGYEEGRARMQKARHKRAQKNIVVRDIERFCTLYGAPFEGSRSACDHCGEEVAADPCPYCGHPNLAEYKNKKEEP